ncbi:hypothetical protein NKI54_35070, partial [Mesorhizobium sp. M0663]|uniref:hypothetical protein n=1 Tax=Mesorhizobium sp. M0663 TaxID=2956981 RepID=UPI00333BAC0C
FCSSSSITRCPPILVDTSCIRALNSKRCGEIRAYDWLAGGRASLAVHLPLHGLKLCDLILRLSISPLFRGSVIAACDDREPFISLAIILADGTW